MRSIVIALAAGAVLSAAAVALASGPPPVDRGYPPPGVTAIGVASVRVDASSRDSQAEIRRAVEAAVARGRPRAFADARRDAQAIATVAGVRLGAVWSVGQDPDIPWPGASVNHGTFGGNDYCGRVRRTVDGRRVYRRECRAPRQIDVYLEVTFAQAEVGSSASAP